MHLFPFCSLTSEEAGLEDSPDCGWRLCLRLHGPLHPEGLSPEGHELPFLFEQVGSLVFTPPGRPQLEQLLISNHLHLIIVDTPWEIFPKPKPPQIPYREVSLQLLH